MFLGGYIRIKADNGNFSYFIDTCKKKNIILYNVNKNCDGCFFDIKGKDYKSIISCAEKCNVNLKIHSKFGLIMKLIIYKSRKAFFAIMLILIMFYGINSCFISEITVSGNKIFADKQILNCLKENGLFVGRLKFGINSKIFQNEVIKDFPEISWVWVRIDGTKAIVDVREKVSLPNFFNYSDYGNIVASNDGVIKSAIASGGTLLVSEGVFVKKGDILINGVYDSNENAPVRFVNADGIVLATTTYSIEDNFKNNYISYKPKSKIQTKYIPKIFNINLWNDKINKNLTVIMPKEEIKYRIFGKNYLPLAFTKTKYCEIIRTEYALSQSESQKLALDELLKRLMLSLPEGTEVTDTKNEIFPNPDGTFKAKVSLTCTENIAVKQPIEVEMQ